MVTLTTLGLHVVYCTSKHCANFIFVFFAYFVRIFAYFVGMFCLVTKLRRFGILRLSGEFVNRKKFDGSNGSVSEMVKE